MNVRLLHLTRRLCHDSQWIELVDRMGFEPTTTAMRVRPSTTELLIGEVLGNVAKRFEVLSKLIDREIDSPPNGERQLQSCLFGAPINQSRGRSTLDIHVPAGHLPTGCGSGNYIGSMRKSRRTRAVASGCSIHGSCPARAMVTWQLFGMS